MTIITPAGSIEKWHVPAIGPVDVPLFVRNHERVNEENEPVLKTIGALIQEARVAKGLSQRQMAMTANVDTKTLSSLETGRRLARDVSMRKIEQVLGWRRGSIQRVLDEAEHLALDKITVADMEEGAEEASWEDLAAGNTNGESPVKRASQLTDEELVAELSYRMRNYHKHVHGESA